MKNTMLRSLSILGISLTMALSVTAQDMPKTKTSDREYRYKTEDCKIKDEKKLTKSKCRVRPMRLTNTERTNIKTGETEVKTSGYSEPSIITSVVYEPPVVTEQVPVPKPVTVAKKTHYRHFAAKRSYDHPKYIVRTKYVRDTVFIASQPEKIVSTQYIHDTVSLTRVDTVEKMQTNNTYSGYYVPRGNFTKVKLKRGKDGKVWMKKKEPHENVKTEKIKYE